MKNVCKNLHSHFESEGHNSFLEDVSITLMVKTGGSDPTKREILAGQCLDIGLYGLDIRVLDKIMTLFRYQCRTL